MSFHSLLSFFLPAALAASAPAAPAPADLLAIRVGRAETVSHGPIEHAVILVEDGLIVAVGPDLPVERGIRVLDRSEWTVMPGLVLPYSRLGLDGRAGAEFNPEVSPAAEILPRSEEYEEVLKLGITTLGIYPPGNGVPGQAIAIRPKGESLEELLVAEGVYLKLYFRADARSKKMVKDAWIKVDEYDDKVAKAKEKWTKDQEKSKSTKKPAEGEKKDDEKPADKPAEKPAEAAKGASKAFVPPPPDDKVKPFLRVRDGKLTPLVSISQAADWAHWLDAIGERKFDFALRVVMQRELDLYEVHEEITKRGCTLVMEPEISYQIGTMRQRNLPAEFANAGSKVVLIPRGEELSAHEEWRRDVGELVKYGLNRGTALKSMTLQGAALMGLDKQFGSLEKGKVANLLFLNGDPLEPATQVVAVMLDGQFVHGEVRQ
jgi:hypothetical protein